MARTRQEVRGFLNAQVGQSVNAKCGALRGQCVSLNKALLEFLGVPNPYAARGNAKDVGNSYVAQGIAKPGAGWLQVCVNPNMGRLFINGKWKTFGHTWIDVSGEANYEQNGAKALRTTKGTRPFSQALQVVNLDQWIIPDKKTKDTLGSNGVLEMNQSLVSQNGKYVAIMQGDGNFVVYNGSRPIWATNTAKKGAVRAIMQSDGNFVLYDNAGRPKWASQTARKNGVKLIMQNDGNLVIYTSANKPVWATNTVGK